jgi:cytochrome c nitrite reductase small subunit
MASTRRGASTHRRWLPKPAHLVAAVLGGVLLGVGTFTVVYAEAPSYLGSEPETCINCHVMQEQYDAWVAGPHTNVATCADCHLPHDDVVAKYAVKAEDGILHAAKFTTGNYPENIRIREKNLEVANQACLYCHSDVTEQMRAIAGPEEELSCVRCHSGVGH